MNTDGLSNSSTIEPTTVLSIVTHFHKDTHSSGKNSILSAILYVSTAMRGIGILPNPSGFAKPTMELNSVTYATPQPADTAPPLKLTPAEITIKCELSKSNASYIK